MTKISVSTHPAGENIFEYVKELEANNDVDMIHCDIMDGQFVEDITYNYETLAKINNSTTIVLDVHLMCIKPWKLIKKYAKAGANIITVHFEAFKSKYKLIKTLKKIRRYGLIAGISLKPDTNIKEIKEFLSYVDMVLIMSVEPGKSGQKFIKNSIEKIKELKKEILNQNLYILIEVDGGINATTAKQVILAGANILVVGNSIYKAKDKAEQIKKIKQA